MTTLLEAIEDDGKSIGKSIKGVFTTLEGELKSVLSDAADSIAEAIKAQAPDAGAEIVTFIDQSALAAVAAAEAVPGAGQVKMEAALATLAAALLTKGLTLAETMLRTLLENALLKFKAKTASAAAS